MTGKAANTAKGADQAQRFRELAKEVGADTSLEAFDKAVRKVAKAPPSARAPISSRPKRKA